MPSSHQWLPVATTTKIVITECSGPMNRHRLGLTRQT